MDTTTRSVCLVESTSTKALDAAIMRIRDELKPITHNKTAAGKTKQGSPISYSYTDLPEMLKILGPFFKKEKILFDTMEVGDGYVLIRLKLYTVDAYEYSGSIHKIYDIANDYPHQRAGALTTARRLFLYGKFGIHPASDDDGNGAQGNDVKATMGEYNADKVSEKLTDMHNHNQKEPFIVSDGPERSTEEVSMITSRMNENGSWNYLKYDGRRYKNMSVFLANAPKSILVAAINAAMNKALKK